MTAIILRSLSDVSTIPQRVAKVWNGKPLELVLRKPRPRRSLDQNSKFHAMLTEFSQHVGYSPRELKMEVKLELGWYRDVTVKGERFRVFDSTADKSKMEMVDAIETLYRMAAEVGYVFNDPETGGGNW